MRKNLLRFLSLLIVVIFALNMSGCASLRKKFTRKRVTKQTKPVFYSVHKYDVKPSMELYEKHYIFWANWHSKITAELGNNFKNDNRCMQEIVGNLDDMYALLSDEEGDKLKPHIDYIKEAKVIIDKRNMTEFNETRIRRILERESRTIEREFTPRKMQGSIRKDWRVSGEIYD